MNTTPTVPTLREKAARFVRRTWLKYTLRGREQSSDRSRVELAYAMPDPWNMSSAQEQARFVETCALIRKEIHPHFDTLLEIGCGEGHQTEHLAPLADHVTGIELSQTAVQRARRRLPAATFRAGDLMEQPWVNERGRFGLVTACEVIFHMKDMPGFLRAIDHLGHHCLVTYYLPLAEKWDVEAYVMKMPGVQRTTFRHGTAEWGAAWWKGEASR